MPADSYPNPPSDALDGLDAVDRALLELSLKRGVSDREIAEILGTDAEAVLESRVALMRSLAGQLALEAEEPEGEPEGEPEPRHERRLPVLRWLPLLVIGAALGVITGVVSNRDGTSKPAQAGQRGVELTRFAGARGSATALVEGDRLRLTLRGVSGQKGGLYEAWLYNSIIDARPIGTISSNGGTLDARLPADAKRYRYVDVSLEPADGNPNHGGQSVLRTRLALLSR